MTKGLKKGKERNCISDCINIANTHDCSHKCGRIRTFKSFQCNTKCLDKNKAEGKVRQLCHLKCNREKA